MRGSSPENRTNDLRRARQEVCFRDSSRLRGSAESTVLPQGHL